MKIFRYSITAVLALLLSLKISAQEYLFPLVDVEGRYSSSYGELRSNHFHSGVDIRTDNVEGKSVVAVADGYVSRISLAPRGFGIAIYVTHPQKGTMSVYGHLSRLRDDIAKYITEDRYKNKVNSKNHYPPADMFRVRRGDVIAYSGNSGSSFGPHLHFEIRDLKSGHVLNPIKAGAIKPLDTIAPEVLRLHYVLIDTLAGRAKSRLVGSYEAKLNNGIYTIADDVKVWGKGHFVIEVLDRRNNSTNRFGIYSVKMKFEESEIFDFRMDRFSFSDSRQCNVVAYYPLQRRAKCEVIALAKKPTAPNYLYHKAVNNGYISLGAGEEAKVDIEVTDECGNLSKLRFNARGIERQRVDLPAQGEHEVLVAGDKEMVLRGECFTAVVPRDALYEPEYSSLKIESVKQLKDTTLVVLSQFCRIFAEDTPINKAVRVVIAANVPAELRSHVSVASVGANGRAGSLGGKFRQDSVEVLVRRGGEFVVVADTVPPTITPRFRSGSDMRGISEIKFVVKDNFSGIGTYRLLIDGEWRTLDYQPIKGELVHSFDRPLKEGVQSHSVQLEVSDNCGNKAVWRGRIIK